MPDIFDEVEEDLRAERAESFARRFGGLGALGVVVVLLGTGGYVWWSQQKAAQTDIVASRFIAAATQADKAETPLGGLDRNAASQAAAAFADIAAHGPAGYAVLARLRLAAVQWQLGEKPQALASWQDVASNGDAPQLLRDLATLSSVQHQVDSAETPSAAEADPVAAGAPKARQSLEVRWPSRFVAMLEIEAAARATAHGAAQIMKSLAQHRPACRAGRRAPNGHRAC